MGGVRLHCRGGGTGQGVGLTWSHFEVILAPLLAIAIAIAGWKVVRRRSKRSVTDEMMIQIEREGRVATTEREPLDLDGIQSQEDEFWSQTWDEPESL